MTQNHNEIPLKSIRIAIKKEKKKRKKERKAVDEDVQKLEPLHIAGKDKKWL